MSKVDSWSTGDYIGFGDRKVEGNKLIECVQTMCKSSDIHKSARIYKQGLSTVDLDTVLGHQFHAKMMSRLMKLYCHGQPAIGFGIQVSPYSVTDQQASIKAHLGQYVVRCRARNLIMFSFSFAEIEVRYLTSYSVNMEITVVLVLI